LWDCRDDHTGPRKRARRIDTQDEAALRTRPLLSARKHTLCVLDICGEMDRPHALPQITRHGMYTTRTGMR
jgi:hypothetical protein